MFLCFLFLSAAAPVPAQNTDTAHPAQDSASPSDNRYADAPYWYQPGHPVQPAEAKSIQVLPGFTVERLFTVHPSLGSWTALTVDPQGRLLAAAQHRPGVHRITPAPFGDKNAQTTLETLSQAAERVGWCHGLLHAYDSLYVTVGEGNPTTKPGIYRLQDLDGDDQFEDLQLLLATDAAGEHGAHNLAADPRQRFVYLMAGNGTPLPAQIQAKRTVQTEGLDHLMPPGFESSSHTTAGWVARFRPDGTEWELQAGGLRNAYDLAFHNSGDLFTFDSDMEWDLGTPWYRPTRICHVVSGAEFGWRGGAAKWPAYYEDSVPGVVDIGPASPTGITFGYGTKFPKKYQQALFACDWTFATIHAVHLEPSGAGFKATVEEFLGGTGLPVTDAVVGRDGHLYFVVGGRKLDSALYRVVYVGPDSSAPVPESEPAFPEKEHDLHALRQKLESWHETADPHAVDEAWPHLGHEDRSIRYAARMAVEHQPVTTWRDRVFATEDPSQKLTALLALARQENPSDLAHMIRHLIQEDLDLPSLPVPQQLTFLRIVELTLARGGDRLASHHDKLRARLHPLKSSTALDWRVRREWVRLLCYLQDASVIDSVLDWMEADKGDRNLQGTTTFTRNPKYGEAVQDMLASAPQVDRMHFAQMLLWLNHGWTDAQRRRYFRLIANAINYSQGGHTYVEFWNRIRETALEQIPESGRDRMASIGAESLAARADIDLPQPEGPGRTWTVEEVLELVQSDGLKQRNLERGKRMYAAAGCRLCHAFQGQGGATGPDLTSLSKRFTVSDMARAIVRPSEVVSDQYQLQLLEMKDGTTLSGRIVARDAQAIRLATDLMHPTKTTEVPANRVTEIRAVPVSTMPAGLLNGLNDDEVLDLLAYLTMPPSSN